MAAHNDKNQSRWVGRWLLARTTGLVLEMDSGDGPSTSRATDARGDDARINAVWLKSLCGRWTQVRVVR